MSTISLIASSLWSDLYGRYIIDRESPYTANEKARLPTPFACCAAAVPCHRVGSSAKLESRTRRLIMLVPPHWMSPPDCRVSNRSSVCRGDRRPDRVNLGHCGDVRCTTALAPKAEVHP